MARAETKTERFQRHTGICKNCRQGRDEHEFWPNGKCHYGPGRWEEEIEYFEIELKPQ